MADISTQRQQYNTLLGNIGASIGKLTDPTRRRTLNKQQAIAEGFELGADFPDDYQIKITPDETADNGFRWSLLTPDYWEINPDNSYVSPEGARYTREEIETPSAVETAGPYASVSGLSARQPPVAETPAVDVSRFGASPAVAPRIAPWTPAEQIPVTTQAPLPNMVYLPDGNWVVEDELAALRDQSPELYDILNTEGMEAYQQKIEEYKADYAEYQEYQTMFSSIFPSRDVNEVMGWATEQPEEFLTELQQMGRNPQTERLLKTMFPEVTSADLNQIWQTDEQRAQAYEAQLRAEYEIKRKQRGISRYPLTRPLTDEEWDTIKRADPDISKQLGIPDSFMAGFENVIGIIDKYVGRPWEIAIMEMGARAQIMKGPITWANPLGLYFGSQTRPADQEAIASIDAAFARYGPAAMFSDEVAEAFDTYRGRTTGVENWALGALEWLNPAYVIPIGGTFGLAAKYTAKIPLIGKATAATAAGVQAAERGIAVPLELGIRGVQKAGAKLGEKAINTIIKSSKHLEIPLEIPGTQAIIDGVIINNWQKRAIQAIGKIPKIGKPAVTKTLGSRILIDKTAMEVEDIVARGAVAYNEITRRGTNSAGAKLWELNAIDRNPTQLLGFDKRAYSTKMADRVLPEFTSEGNIGTLEDVFTHPERYNWDGLEKGLDYVTRVHEINTEVLKLLQKEGVAPKQVIEDWIHRVVTGIERTPGEIIENKKLTDFLKHRRMETMADGIAAGVYYDPHIERSVSEYIQSAYRKIASERLNKYLEGLSVDLQARLIERYPNLFEEVTVGAGKIPSKDLIEVGGKYYQPKAKIAQEALADAADFNKAIWRAIRGEKLPEQTLTAIEREFPELGRRFRNILEGTKPYKPTGNVVEQARAGAENPKQVDMFGYPEPETVKMPGQKPIATVPEQLRQIQAELEADVSIARKKIAEVKTPEPTVGADVGFSRAALDDAEKLLARNKTLLKKLEKGIAISDDELAALTDDVASLKDYIKYTEDFAKGKAEQLRILSQDVKTAIKERRGEFWQAKSAQARAAEKVRQPGIGEGFVLEPIAARGKVWTQEYIDAFNRFFGYDKGSGVLKATADVAGILRLTKAALDFSVMAIQGLPSWGLAHAYMLVNPQVGAKLMGNWYKAFGYSVASFFDPVVLAKFVEKNQVDIGRRIKFGGSVRAVDYFDVLSQEQGGLAGLFGKVTGLPSKLGERLPGRAGTITSAILESPYKRAEVAFLAGSEMVRDSFWKILAPKAIKNGNEYKLARFLDIITGIGDSKAAGVPLTNRQLEQTFMWFAPNYTRASLSLLADIFRGGYTGAEARKALGGMIAAGGTMYSAVQYSMASMEGKSHEDALQTVFEGFGVRTDPITGEITWKPTANFMAIKIGNYYFKFGGFWHGLLRLSGNIIDTITDENARIDLVTLLKNGKPNRDNPFIYWWYTRSSPIVGTAFDLMNNTDFLGYPISTDEEGKPTDWVWESPQQFAQYIATRFEPIWMEQGVNWMIPGMARQNEIPEGAARKAIIGAEIFGLATFPESAWVKFYDKTLELAQRLPQEELDPKQVEAWQSGKLGWQQLTKMQQQNLLMRYPELNELYTLAQGDSAVRDSGDWARYTQRMDTEREIYYERLDEATQQWQNGEINGRAWSKKVGEIGQNYGAIMDSMQREPSYADIFDYFDQMDAKGDKYGLTDNIILAEYQTQILYTEDLELQNGDYDWDERDRRVDAFIEKWGLAKYEQILKYLADKKSLKGLNPAVIWKSEVIEKLGREYWRLNKPLDEMTADDEAIGRIPPEYLAKWKEFQTLNPEQREAFKSVNPELFRDYRGEYRVTHPEADAALAILYGGKLQSRKAYDLVEQYAKELGIPFDFATLGMPPRSLANKYFDYNALVRVNGASSAEARLFRIDNSEWDKWGQENMGWKPVEDNVDALRISVKWSEVDNQYDSLTGDEEGRLKLLEANPEYATDRFRREVFKKDGSADIAELYVGYGNITKQYGAGSSEAKLYRIDNPDLDTWAQSGDTFKWSSLADEKVPVLRINAQWQQQDEEYSALKDDEARTKYLIANEEYRKARREREFHNLNEQTISGEEITQALAGLKQSMQTHMNYQTEWDKKWLNTYYDTIKVIELYRSGKADAQQLKTAISAMQEDVYLVIQASKDFAAKGNTEMADYYRAIEKRTMQVLSVLNRLENTEGMVKKFVDYYELSSTGYRRERYLIENTDLGNFIQSTKGITLPDPSKVPAAPYDEIYEKYKPQFDQYYDLHGDERQAFLETNPEFKENWYRRNAYGLMFPEKHIEDYTSYNLLPTAGYAKDRYLKENPGFYETAKGILGWTEEIDFAKVPTERVESLWNEYLAIPAGTPSVDYGVERTNFRFTHPDLDAWLVLAKGYKPVGSPRAISSGDTTTTTISQQEAEYNQTLSDISALLGGS